MRYTLNIIKWRPGLPGIIMLKRKRFSSQEGLEPFLQPGVTLIEGLPAPVEGPVLTGEVQLHSRGFGFVSAMDGVSYFMSESKATGLLSGDVIDFRVHAPTLDGKKSSPEVVRVDRVVRREHLLLCEVQTVGEGWQLQSDEPIGMALRVEAWPVSNTVPGWSDTPWQDGEVVAVAVPAYEGVPSAAALAVTLVRRLGLRTREGFDLDYARVRYGFDEEFPDALLEEAAQAVFVTGDNTDVEWLAYGAYPFVTIDSESTRDLDDALWACRREDGGWDLKVAIADVSWYVRPGTALDRWAQQRATSLYLPGQVVPMLPELLSNERCSLIPGEVRRAVVLSLQLDAKAQVRSVKVGRALIQSAARLSYTQVASFMDGDLRRVPEAVRANVQVLQAIYHTLDARRRAQGRLDFDDAEPVLGRDASGRWQFQLYRRTAAHKLVEELMLLANREVANLLVARHGAGLFRHQPAPNPQAWRDMQDWAQRKGQSLDDAPSLKSLSSLLDAEGDLDYREAAALRIKTAMRPATYVFCSDEDDAGHFSLDVEWYTHFSSPIRRYADLLVHRLLLAKDDEAHDLEALIAQGRRCAVQSRRARQAERSVWESLKIKALMAQVPAGEEQAARVLKSTPRGAKILFTGWGCPAWVPAGALRKAGLALVAGSWTHPSLGVLEAGVGVRAAWQTLDVRRPAYPELMGSLRLVERELQGA